ncbi:hypothetical protein SCLCIDRAFT_31843 [Scleroderma citrinum Foug A]|uniref:Uncharacterized protein n=1 Tax=Scleroderma citrinum Foug A TaxID=1036808 RepID=A0A0C2ZLG5_9AGAM|nr:hypothetical protein SCLCIDRAFT_31843 [Scleroderma citrinum Foug A]
MCTNPSASIAPSMITAVPPTIIAFPPVVTPITGTIATPTTAAVAATPSTVSTLAELSTSEKKDVMSRACTNICSFIVAEEAVPAESTQNEMVARAIHMALESVVGFASVGQGFGDPPRVMGKGVRRDALQDVWVVQTTQAN